jgi:hypothetical protein
MDRIMDTQMIGGTYPHGDHELSLFITPCRIARHDDVAKIATDSLPHPQPALPWRECIAHQFSSRILLAPADDLR